jgi:hypothetical protein
MYWLLPVGLSVFRKYTVRIMDESPASLFLDFPQSYQANDSGNTFKRTMIASFQICSPFVTFPVYFDAM